MIKQLLAVLYFTDENYRNESKRLIDSLKINNLPFVSRELACKGSWAANCRQKPSFLLDMLDDYGSRNNLLYLDSDAELHRYPDIFNPIQFDIAVHKRDSIPEPQSGTIFLTENRRTRLFLESWSQLANNEQILPDQELMGLALKGSKVRIQNLPPEYCCIFDLTRKDFPHIQPVIEHHQASRRLKQLVGIRRERM